MFAFRQARLCFMQNRLIYRNKFHIQKNFYSYSPLGPVMQRCSFHLSISSIRLKAIYQPHFRSTTHRSQCKNQGKKS